MKALLIVDIQNDFLPGGTLAVNEGDQVVSVANEWMDRVDFVVATQDWHPPHHLSFASQHEGLEVGAQIELDGLPQTLWPDHCIEFSPGADFPEALNDQLIQFTCRKGTDPRIDSYSGFFDNGHRQSTELQPWLSRQSVDELVVLGLATDFCVKFTVLDALELGFKTTVLSAGCRGVNVNKGDDKAALEAMRAAGATII